MFAVHYVDNEGTLTENCHDYSVDIDWMNI